MKCSFSAENPQKTFCIILSYNYMGLLRAIMVRTEYLLIPKSVMSRLQSCLGCAQLSFKAAIRADPTGSRVSWHMACRTIYFDWTVVTSCWVYSHMQFSRASNNLITQRTFFLFPYLMHIWGFRNLSLKNNLSLSWPYGFSVSLNGTLRSEKAALLQVCLLIRYN